MKSRNDAEHSIVTDRLKSLENAAEVIADEMRDTTAEAFAKLLGIARTRLRSKLAIDKFASPDERERRPHIAAGELAMLPVANLISIVNRLYLEPNGYAAVKLPTPTRSASNLELVTTMHRESSEATSAALDAFSKGHMDRSRALVVIKESREAIQVHLEAISIAETALREGVISFGEERRTA